MIVKVMRFARDLFLMARRPVSSTPMLPHQAMINAAPTKTARRRAREQFVRKLAGNDHVFSLISATPGVPSRRSVMINIDVGPPSSASQMLIVTKGRYARVMLLTPQRPALNS